MLHEQSRLKNAANTVKAAASTSKMCQPNVLQIRWKMKGSNSNMLQKPIEMAASSSKMLRIARKPGRKNG